MGDVNKVTLFEEVLIDLTKDTVSQENLLSDIKAHNAVGDIITGGVPIIKNTQNSIANESSGSVLLDDSGTIIMDSEGNHIRTGNYLLMTPPMGYYDGTQKIQAPSYRFETMAESGMFLAGSSGRIDLQGTAKTFQIKDKNSTYAVSYDSSYPGYEWDVDLINGTAERKTIGSPDAFFQTEPSLGTSFSYNVIPQFANRNLMWSATFYY